MKKILTIVLSLMLLLSLSGCFLFDNGNGNKDYSHESPEMVFKMFVAAINTKDFDLALESSARTAEQSRLESYDRNYWNRIFNGLEAKFTYSNFQAIQTTAMMGTFNYTITATYKDKTEQLTGKRTDVVFVKVNEEWYIDYHYISNTMAHLQDMRNAINYSINNSDTNNTPDTNNPNTNNPSNDNQPNGDGTQTNPYLIYNKTQLKKVAEQLNEINKDGYYNSVSLCLCADIDLDGEEWDPIQYFSGVFDGNNFTISNFKISTLEVSPHGAYIGFFGINGGTIQNLKIENININIDISSEEPIYTQIGSLVGRNDGQIINCSANGNISAELTTNIPLVEIWADVGGLIGCNTSDVTQCNTEIIINTLVNTYSGNISGTYGYLNVGGLIGKINSTRCNIKNCYAISTITADNPGYSLDVGALIGTVDRAVIKNCYATAAKNISIANTKGLTGIGNMLITDSFSINISNTADIKFDSLFVGDVSIQDNSYPLSQLNSKSFYTDTLGWSEDIWDFSDLDFENGKTPTLKPQ